MPYATGKRKRRRGGPSRKRMRTRGRRMYTKRRGMASFIKRVMLKQCETKHRTESAENLNLRHNSPHARGVMTKLDHGTDENQRVGDELIGKYIKCKFQFFSKQDRTNVTYRIIVYRAPQGEGDGYFDIMENVIANKMLDNVNTEKYTPIFQKFVKIQGNNMIGPSVGLLGTQYDWYMNENSKMVSFTIPLKDVKIKYENDSQFPKFQRDTIKRVVFLIDGGLY